MGVMDHVPHLDSWPDFELQHDLVKAKLKTKDLGEKKVNNFDFHN